MYAFPADYCTATPFTHSLSQEVLKDFPVDISVVLKQLHKLDITIEERSSRCSDMLIEHEKEMAESKGKWVCGAEV